MPGALRYVGYGTLWQTEEDGNARPRALEEARPALGMHLQLGLLLRERRVHLAKRLEQLPCLRRAEACRTCEGRLRRSSVASEPERAWPGVPASKRRGRIPTGRPQSR